MKLDDPQKIGERGAGGRGGELDIETRMSAAERRSGSLDIEPKRRCMQEGVERRGGEA